VVAWLLALGFAPMVNAALLGGFVPGRVLGGVTVIGALPVAITPLTATLLHADLLHLGFNMLMLVWCGRQVEPALGGKLLLTLYVIGAYGAALGQWLLEPAAASVMIGASGAVSAIVAVYALVFSEQKVRAIGPIPPHIVRALWLGTAWIVLQTMIGLGFGVTGGLVAVGAHIGGFVTGLLLARPLLRLRFRKS
jgi:membrane associated rhomboid family serine protease